ncbi:hypothetical protein C4B63_43g75 [Trypanosoma cruzi]|uniref:Uncharacterized protein n=1 Tax=Trypanosoma cruzi TaxID=5693 RepID=A0A2V2V543_TRYCR|nr:hypothetical protein C4B63_43g75 [Trypanosoma cruzi]
MRVDGNTVQLNCPQPLRDAGFAVAGALFDVDVALDVPDASTLFRKLCATAAPKFTQERKNMVVFSYGVRSSPKRQLMYGSAAGEVYAACVITEFIRLGAKKDIFALSCLVIGSTEHRADLLDADNELGVIVGSVKEGPRVRMAARICVSLAGEVRAAMDTIVKTMRNTFFPCCVKSSQRLSWRQCLLICPTPSFFSFTAMMVRRSLQIVWMQTP